LEQPASCGRGEDRGGTTQHPPVEGNRMTPDVGSLQREVDYIILLFALFVVPRLLQRFRLPPAITAVALGAVASMGFGLFVGDLTIALLATLGIVALFLFAGLDVSFPELRRESRVLLQHLSIGAVVLVLVAVLLQMVFDLGWRPAVLVALALLTPSTGFILDSLPHLGLPPDERFWIKSKAVATELLALVFLFVTLQSATATQLSVSVLTMGGMILLLPVAFRIFARRIVPHAPNSEFGFLLMMAAVCAFVTLRLGVYYLVGAFVVGVTAQRFRQHLPAMTSDRMLQAIELFATFFVPFYFFNAGLHLRPGDFDIQAVAVGMAFLLVMAPTRVILIAAHRRVVLGESWGRGARIGVSMLPTLVFTLVIAGILRDSFALPPAIFGGLIIYTLGNTLIPGLTLGTPAAELDVWHAPADAAIAPAATSPTPDATGSRPDEPGPVSEARGAGLQAPGSSG
jgi:Kef-type K+ transport system membrane component KefB